MKVPIDELGRELQKNMDRQARAFQRTMVRTVNRAAGMAQDKLLAAFKRDFRAPVGFTTSPRGYKLSLARMGDEEPPSKFTIKQAQSDFLRFPIEGGERTPGDAGTSDKYVLKPTRHAKLTASGALQRFFTREVVGKFGKDKGLRGGGGGYAGFIGKGTDRVRAAPASSTRRMRPATSRTSSGNGRCCASATPPRRTGSGSPSRTTSPSRPYIAARTAPRTSRRSPRTATAGRNGSTGTAAGCPRTALRGWSTPRRTSGCRSRRRRARSAPRNSWRTGRRTTASPA